eukprot:458643_1
MSSVWYVIIYLGFILLLSAKTYYVRKNGIDYIGCGNSLNTACGTLYFVSLQFNQGETNTIEIYDGQNIDIINEYLTSNTTYYPCLPIPIHSTVFGTAAIFNFNSTYVTTMNDWYPIDICKNNPNASKYQNKYLLECASSGFYINSLIIEDYDTDHNPFGLLSADMFISCNHCLFRDISNRLNNPMLNTSKKGFVRIWNSLVVNLFSTSNFMDVGVNNKPPFDGTNVYIETSSFLNITLIGSLINIPNGFAYIDVQHSKFKNISTTISIISVQATIKSTPMTTILATEFEAIESGSIIICHSTVYSKPSVINMSNVYISTSQLANDYGLIYVNEIDEVFMNDIIVRYNYDLFANCYQDPDDINGMLCNQPVSFITNYVVATINNLDMKINISLLEYFKYKQTMKPNSTYMYMKYASDSTSCIICNYNELDITNLSMD